MRYLWMLLVTSPLCKDHQVPSETRDRKTSSELVSAWPPSVAMEGTLGHASAGHLPSSHLVSSHCLPRVAVWPPQAQVSHVLRASPGM